MRCCQNGCPLLRQIEDLFQCVEVLRKSPESPPYCTRTCHNLTSEVLSTEYGLDLLSCNCSSVENVPKMKYLCKPFQSHAIKKCININFTPSGKHVVFPFSVKYLAMFMYKY